MIRIFAVIMLMVTTALMAASPARAQSGGSDPLVITVAGGEFKPVTIAAPGFFAAPGKASDLAAQIRAVVMNDLTGSGLFREIPPAAYIQQISDFSAAPAMRTGRRSALTLC